MTPSGLVRIVPVVCALFAAEIACAQNFPVRPIRMITSAAGGSSDFAARLVAQGMSIGLGQQVIVDNRGGGVAAIEIIQKAPPDGYSLLYYGSILWLLPLLQDNVPYDTLRDFIPVSLSVSSPNIIIVHPSLPVKSVKDLIALAKAKPGALNYGSGGAGSSGHMAAELFKSMAGVNLVRIPFKGSGPALNAVLSGEVQVLMSSAGGLSQHIASGRVRALAVTGAKRSASFPDLPTVSESGLRGYVYGQYSGVLAPAKTPAAIVDRLSKDAARAVSGADTKDKLLKSGVDAEGSTPQEFATLIKDEIARLGKVIKEAKIRAE